MLNLKVLNVRMASKSSCQHTVQLMYSLLTLKVEQTPTAESISFYIKDLVLDHRWVWKAAHLEATRLYCPQSCGDDVHTGLKYFQEHI